MPSYLSKLLPVVESATREGPIIRQSTIGSQLTGLRKEQVRNPVELELVKAKIFENETIIKNPFFTFDTAMTMNMTPYNFLEILHRHLICHFLYNKY